MELTAETTFDILAAPEVFEEFEDLYLHPENSGTNALRELRYPGDILPPLIYECNPDRWDNFDSVPWTDKPQVKVEMTLGSTQVVQWRGYQPDRPVREVWRGADNRSRMFAYFLRRLYEYYVNPPPSGYIIWWPKDRTQQGYRIHIEALEVGGQDTIAFDFLAFKADLVVLEVVFRFRIVGVV
ncbi:MAG: hypothetical protein JRI66_10895 [Deltaproteobacteria bacterium]|nr:hypothetical protein [Deltaproteobacteria bacterium]